MTVIVLIVGASIGAGLVLIGRGLHPTTIPLADIVRSLERAPHGRWSTPERASDISGRAGNPLAALARRVISLGLLDSDALRSRLRVLDKSLERHAYEKVFGAVAGFVLVTITALALVASGVAVSPFLAVLAAVLMTVGGFFYPDIPLEEQVERRRQAFRHSLSAYLDLVTIILAGGGGIESALEGAADAGDGWAFAEIRATLRRSRLTNSPPWQGFHDLGDRLGIDELRELSSSVALAGGHGARVKESLTARADAMRAAQAAGLEAAAESQTEKMIVPVVVLILGLVLFIGYGAVDAISSPPTPTDTTSSSEAPTSLLLGGGAPR